MRRIPHSAVWFRRRLSLFGILLLFLVTGESRAAEPVDEVAALAARIDAEIAAAWKDAEAVPAAPASDAEFLRRVSLHVTGCIPDVATTRRFLADESPDKRRRYVDDLLDSAGYVTNFARFWRSVMLPDGSADFQTIQFTPGFEGWLRQELAAETAYDEMARQILGVATPAPNQRPYAVSVATNANAFYLARQSKPPEVAAATARVFLGLRIDCAQCHDHPFDTWKREQFWSMAAFFDTTRSAPTLPAPMSSANPTKEPATFTPPSEVPGPTIRIPDTERTVGAAFLDGERPKWTDQTNPRHEIAEWVTSRENPYFARAAVNRLWGYFFGRGLVDPVDDFSEANPPSHPALLDLLAEEFVRHDFDLKFLIRAITASQAYQLTSVHSHASQSDPRLFAVMPVQWLSAEQIADSYAQATGMRTKFDPQASIRRARSSDASLESLFADDGRASTEREATVLQALGMMNGNETTRATEFRSSRTLAAVSAAPFLDTSEKVETLFLAALCRPPTDAERRRLVAYVESGGPAKDTTAALEDIFWALLNSSEFLLNH